jgi:hypothetical protein
VTKKGPLLLTQAKYAASRKARGLPGGSREAVRKAVDAGRISAFGPDKMVDPELADRQWAENTRARAANDAATEPVGEPAVSPAPGGDAEMPAATPGSLAADPGYQGSRAREAAADASLKELKLAEEEGRLVRIDQVRAELAAKLAPVREGLLQIPARLASMLAAQSDPSRIQTTLETEIHQVLAPLASMVVPPAPSDGAAA